MNCPYCNKAIYAFTGLQELQKFEQHLRKCRKNPNNIALSGHVPEQPTTVQADALLASAKPRRPKRRQTINDALEIRAASGQ